MDDQPAGSSGAARSSVHDEEMLARIRTVRDELAEARRRRGPPEPLDEAELAVVEALTSDPEARPGFRLLRSRVEAGATTWDRIWATEHTVEVMSLKLAVMSRLYSREQVQPALDGLAAISTEVEKDPERFWDRVEQQRAEREGAEAAGTGGPDRPGGEGTGRPGTLGAPSRGRWSAGRTDGTGAGSRG